MPDATSARILRLLCLAVFCLCPRVSLAQRAAIYAVTSTGDALRQIDPSAPFEKFGAYPDGVLNCLAADKGNRLFTIHSPVAPAECVLLELNPQSGEFTRIATLSERLNVRAASFTADGRLVAIALTPGERAGAAPISTLFQIDTASGACTRLGRVSHLPVEALCLGYTGQLYGIASKGPGLLLIDDATGASSSAQIKHQFSAPITSFAWSSPESMFASASDTKSPGSGIAKLDSAGLDFDHPILIPGHRITGIECLPSAAAAGAARPGWTAVASVGNTSVSASIRRINLSTSFEPGRLDAGARELTIEASASRRGSPILPLVSREIEVMEIRDQNGADLMKYVLGQGVARLPYGTTDRGNGIWSDDWSVLNPKQEPDSLTLSARVKPAEQVTGLSILRLRVHALAPSQPRQVNFSPEMKAPILLRGGVEAKLERATGPLWNGSLVTKLSIVISDPAAVAGRSWAPVFILDAHCLGADGTADPVPFVVYYDHTTLGTAQYRLHATPGARPLSNDEVIRITFITDPQELNLDLTLKDVPL